MKEIPLTRGKVALVDDDVYGYLMQWKWFAVKPSKSGDIFYAVRNLRGRGRGSEYMHHAVLKYYKTEIPEGEEIDHINLNALDNRISNLRVCSHQQNNFNKRSYKNSSSKFKGVSWEAWTGRWKAQIMFGGKQINLGRYDTEEEAAKAYNAKAENLFGKFARRNSISERG